MDWGTKWDKDDLISRRAQDIAWLWRLDSDLPGTWPPGPGWVWKAWVAAAGESAVNMWLEVAGGVLMAALTLAGVGRRLL